MVRIESSDSKLGIAATMIDGYAPEPDEFHLLQWGQIRKQKGLNYWEWLYRIRANQRKVKRQYNESTYLTAYRNAIKALRRAYCPMKKKPGFGPRRLLEPISVYTGFTTGHNRGSIETTSIRVIRKHLSVLQREYRHDEQEGRLHYIQNVFLYPSTTNHQCAIVDDCNVNWMRLLAFQEKPEDAYIDHAGFSHAWSRILEDMTDFHPGRTLYWHLYDHLGIQYLHLL